MRARVVIGAGYGDEGKGLLTDALAAQASAPPLVVRFNGGAQAGHTVVAPDGRRHVFAHVGSGAFLGCATFLSRFFVSNPALLHREWDELAALGVTPRVLADRHGPVTTPFDMLVNQVVETARGAGQHGSVGIGFGETIERNLQSPYAIAVGDLGQPDRLRGVLRAIRGEYVPARLRRLGVEPGEALQALLADDALIERFLDDAALFLARVTATGGAPLRDAQDLVFEGAQGLLLDQHRGAFPHVTRSCTGLANVLTLAGEAGIAALEVTYTTRAYVTRHGAGPLAHALPGPPSPGVVDRTNRPHPFQGSLRFATLDLDVLRGAVLADLSDAPAGIAVTARMAVTCLDQLPGPVACVEAGERRTASAEALASRVGAICPGAPVLVSRGETRDTLREGAG